MDWLAMAKEVGILASLVGFFVWQSWKREERLSARIALLEQFVESRLIGLIEATTTALNHSTKALEQTSGTVGDLARHIQERDKSVKIIMEKLASIRCIEIDCESAKEGE